MRQNPHDLGARGLWSGGDSQTEGRRRLTLLVLLGATLTTL